MPDTGPVATVIADLITAGIAERPLIAAVVHLFPNLSPAELSQAIQVATTEAERQATRRY